MKNENTSIVDFVHRAKTEYPRLEATVLFYKNNLDYIRLDALLFPGKLRADTMFVYSQEKQPQHGTHPGLRCSLTLENFTSLHGVSVPEIETELLPIWLEDCSPVARCDASRVEGYS